MNVLTLVLALSGLLVPFAPAAHSASAAAIAPSDSLANEPDTLALAFERAVWSNDLDETRRMLADGVDVNHVDANSGFAPIHWATDRGYAAMIDLLLSHGARINIRTQETTGNDRTPLHIAAENGSAAVVALLIKRGGDVKASTVYGETPLHGVRTFVRNPEVVRLLITNGADVNATTVYGSAPIHAAALVGSLDVTRVLIEYGARINVSDKRGQTPFFHAAQQGFTEIVRLFLDQDAYVNAITRNGYTPLHVAAKNGFIDIVRLLLNRGADPMTADKYGRTPISDARIRGYGEIVGLLEPYVLPEVSPFDPQTPAVTQNEVHP